jgi:hypothetical protein
METVKILESSREELPGVEGAERSEGDDGNCGGPRWPDGCGCVGAGRPITRMGKGTTGQQGVGGGRSTDRAGRTTQPPEREGPLLRPCVREKGEVGECPNG